MFSFSAEKEKHGYCLCGQKPSNYEVVTENTREGAGLWVRCLDCNLVINQQGLLKENLKTYYNCIYQEKNSFRSGDSVSSWDHYYLAMQSIRPVAQQVTPYLRNCDRVMDIGAATGEFLSLIQDQVAYCFGVEFNETYCRFIKEKLKIDATSEDYFSLKFSEKFDLITINGTIDHMYNSLGVLDKIAYDLKPGGLLYLQTPNDEQALRTILPEPSRTAFETFMYQKAHYLSFSMATLTRALHQAGFCIISQMTRHDYTLRNFLHWYFLGQSQKHIHDAKVVTRFFPSEDELSEEMNHVFKSAEQKFHALLQKHNAGELLSVVAEVIK